MTDSADPKVRDALETAKAFLIYLWNNYELEEDAVECDEAIQKLRAALTPRNRMTAVCRRCDPIVYMHPNELDAHNKKWHG